MDECVLLDDVPLPEWPDMLLSSAAADGFPGAADEIARRVAQKQADAGDDRVGGTEARDHQVV